MSWVLLGLGIVLIILMIIIPPKNGKGGKGRAKSDLPNSKKGNK
jgi:hypothetical protein